MANTGPSAVRCRGRRLATSWPLARQCASRACATLLAHRQQPRRGGALPELAPQCGEVALVQNVEEHGVEGLNARARPAARQARLVVERAPIDQFDARQPLAAEMAAQVGLVHGGDRVAAHGRMPIDAVHGTIGARSGEQLAEAAVAPRLELAAEDRHQRMRPPRAQAQPSPPRVCRPAARCRRSSSTWRVRSSTIRRCGKRPPAPARQPWPAARGRRPRRR